MNGGPCGLGEAEPRLIPGDERRASFEKIQAIGAFRESPLFTAAERAALAYAEAVTATPTVVTDAAVEHFRAKFNTALGIQAQGLCVLPPR